MVLDVLDVNTAVTRDHCDVLMAVVDVARRAVVFCAFALGNVELCSRLYIVFPTADLAKDTIPLSDAVVLVLTHADMVNG